MNDPIYVTAEGFGVPVPPDATALQAQALFLVTHPWADVIQCAINHNPVRGPMGVVTATVTAELQLARLVYAEHCSTDDRRIAAVARGITGRSTADDVAMGLLVLVSKAAHLDWLLTRANESGLARDASARYHAGPWP